MEITLRCRDNINVMHDVDVDTTIDDLVDMIVRVLGEGRDPDCLAPHKFHPFPENEGSLFLKNRCCIMDRPGNLSGNCRIRARDTIGYLSKEGFKYFEVWYPCFCMVLVTWNNE